LRDAYDEIRDLGGEVVAIGTGSPAQARDFVEREQIPYPVLADDDGRAARSAMIERVGMFRLFDPASFPGGIRAWRAGHRIGESGRRVDQLGATFVVLPGPRLGYEHRDAHTADHAPLGEVLAALAEQGG
jgi:peroxiredoxin